MGMYRKIPKVVNAYQWFPPNPDSAESMKEDELGVLYDGEDDKGPFGKLRTIEGRVVIRPGDWVVSTSYGWHRIVSKDDFEHEYEAVSKDKEE